MNRTCAGFTLIELLAVLTIISILTLVAVPQYQSYRARGYDTVARMDLRSVAIAEEAYFFDHERYLACNQEACLALPGITALSKGVELEVTTAEPEQFEARASHEKGTGARFTWSSEEGGMQS